MHHTFATVLMGGFDVVPGIKYRLSTSCVCGRAALWLCFRNSGLKTRIFVRLCFFCAVGSSSSSHTAQLLENSRS